MTSVSSYSTRSHVPGSSLAGGSSYRTAHPLASSPEWIHARFERAVDMIQSLPKSGPIQTTYDQKLHLYSFYKQATEGDIRGSRPGILDILGRAKWDAWNKCKGLSQLEAERLYVDALVRVLRGYKDRTQAVGLMRELERFELQPEVPTAPVPHPDSDSSTSTASYKVAPSRIPSVRHPATPTTTRYQHATTPLTPDEVAPPLPGYGPPRTRADPVRYPSSTSESSSQASEAPKRRRRPPPQSSLTASNLRTVAVPPPPLDAALDRIQTSLTALHERLTLLETPAPPTSRMRLLSLRPGTRGSLALRLLWAILASFRRIAGDLTVVFAVIVLIGRLRGVDVLRLVASRVLGRRRAV
ncbi:hypothetical protein BMF94_3377 [Rhodotorula taiwanensis]|uniref:ACB domain-containing protein n=1 Tax=Rhodotorula taiwanensis TaxID=741276 RepID=A0A2S5BAN7_9BASI|nr:hypothetical protein BMF94_3377 [Rhodotorula taiwanensis]